MAPGPDTNAELSIVVASGSGDLARTFAALDPGAAAEVVVTYRWRAGAEPPPVPADLSGTPVRLVPVAAEGEAASANAGLAAARSRFVVVLRGGDVTTVTTWPAGRLIAGVTHPAIGDAWVGDRPAAAPRTAGRHLVLERAWALGLGGFDDRLHDLDVAAVDLVARAADAGVVPSVRRDLAVEGPLDAVAAGRSALVLDQLAADRATVSVGPRRAALRLRWGGRMAPGGPLRVAFARGRGLPVLPAGELDRVGPPSAAGERPPVTVIVPFAGDRARAERLLDALLTLERGPGDALIVADNSAAAVVEERDGVRVVRATAEPSSYHARNAAAEAAGTEWLLFTDDDCRPVPWLLEAFFSPPPADRCGAVAGAVLAAAGAGGWAERYAEWAGVLSQPRMLELQPAGAVTANLLVRREAWLDAGGFCEGIRSGGDRELCWRLQERGWGVEWRPHAAVEHHHRATAGGLLRQYARYGAGAGWLSRHAGADERWTWPTPVLISAFARDLATARPQSAAMRAGWALCVLAAAWGRLGDNRARPAPTAMGAVGVATTWPADGGGADAVEAERRASRPARTSTSTPVAYAEDDGPRERVTALVRLALRGRRAPLADAAAAWRCRAATSVTALEPAAEQRAARLRA